MNPDRIECTLQEAVGRCKKDGGTFWMKDHIEPYKYRYDSDDLNPCKIIDEKGNKFELEWVDFERTWVYEPPQKSAFQWWVENAGIMGLTDTMRKKEGWNAALEEVMKLEIRTYGDTKMSPEKMIPPDQVKKLIE